MLHRDCRVADHWPATADVERPRTPATNRRRESSRLSTISVHNCGRFRAPDREDGSFGPQPLHLGRQLISPPQIGPPDRLMPVDEPFDGSPYLNDRLHQGMTSHHLCCVGAVDALVGGVLVAGVPELGSCGLLCGFQVRGEFLEVHSRRLQNLTSELLDSSPEMKLLRQEREAGDPNRLECFTGRTIPENFAHRLVSLCDQFLLSQKHPLLLSVQRLRQPWCVRCRGEERESRMCSHWGSA